MNSQIINNIWRAIGLILLQILILKRAVPDFGLFQYVHLVVFPLFLFLLPLRTPHSVVIFLGFVTGLIVDVAYDSLGVHASAGVFVGFLRPMIIGALEPRGGYTIGQSPSVKQLGWNWFLPYVSIMLLLFLIFFFVVESFSFRDPLNILKRTILSFVFSILIIIVYQFILDPKD